MRIRAIHGAGGRREVEQNLNDWINYKKLRPAGCRALPKHEAKLWCVGGVGDDQKAEEGARGVVTVGEDKFPPDKVCRHPALIRGGPVSDLIGGPVV